MSINVLTYNVSWESTEPITKDWNKTKNRYEPDMKEKDQGDGEDGLGHMCQSDVDRCRNNIFSIIENGNYDLVGMQEYVHTHYATGESVYRDRMASLAASASPLKLVQGHVVLPAPWLAPGATTKRIDIGSLYNSEKFKLKSYIIGEFLINRVSFNRDEKHFEQKDEVEKEGRPILILHLKHQSSDRDILFINAHMPQTRNIAYGIDPATGNLLDINMATESIQNAINKTIKKLDTYNDIDQDNVRIILATDSNDVKEDGFVKKIKILNKKLNHGTNYKPTCCTTVVNKINDKGRKARRIRYGDIILDSENFGFTYKYPIEKEGEPYSDHAPVATQLKDPDFKDGRRSPGCVGPGYCALQGGKKRRRTRKRRRKKRTKKKARKHRRKRTRRRGGEPTYHKMPPRRKTQKKHFQRYPNPKSSEIALQMKKEVATKSGIDAEMSNFGPGKSNQYSPQYTDLVNRKAERRAERLSDKQEVEEARRKRKMEYQLTRRGFDIDGFPKSPKTHHKFLKISRTGGSKKLSTPQKEKLKKTLKIKIGEQEINMQKLKIDLLRKKLGGPRKIKSIRHIKSKRRKKTKKNKTRKK